MKKYMLLILVAVFLAGCGSQEISQPVEELPDEVVEVVDAVDWSVEDLDVPLTPVKVAGNVKALSGRYRESNQDGSWLLYPGKSQIIDLDCKRQEVKEGTITFTVMNPTTNTYMIGGENPTISQREKGIQFNINSKRIKRADAQDRCGTTTLEPRGSVTCVVERQLNRYVSDGLQKEQVVRVVAPKWTSRVLFLCP